MWPARILALLLVIVEGVALVTPRRGRPVVVAPEPLSMGQAGADAATTLLAADPAGETILHRLTADDVARGVWGLRAEGHTVSVDAVALREAVALHAKVGELKAARRAAAAAVASDGAELARWEW